MFDIRVSYNKYGEAEFRHGSMAFEGDVEGENCFIVKIHMKEYTK